jgi:hypothetical protein
MKKYGKELEFISWIKRDGSDVIPVGTEWNKDCGHPKTDDMNYLDDTEFEIRAISMTYKTFIASGFNTWVVKLKENEI